MVEAGRGAGTQARGVRRERLTSGLVAPHPCASKAAVTTVATFRPAAGRWLRRLGSSRRRADGIRAAREGLEARGDYLGSAQNCSARGLRLVFHKTGIIPSLHSPHLSGAGMAEICGSHGHRAAEGRKMQSANRPRKGETAVWPPIGIPCAQSVSSGRGFWRPGNCGKLGCASGVKTDRF